MVELENSIVAVRRKRGIVRTADPVAAEFRVLLSVLSCDFVLGPEPHPEMRMQAAMPTRMHGKNRTMFLSSRLGWLTGGTSKHTNMRRRRSPPSVFDSSGSDSPGSDPTPGCEILLPLCLIVATIWPDSPQ